MPTEPMIPAVYDVLWYALPLVAGILLIASIITIVKATHLSNGARVGWTAVVVLLPIVGSAIWLLHHWAVQRGQRQLSTSRTSETTT